MGNQGALPDVILELVFLGLDSLLWLHRAASTCERWRHIIAGDAFRALYGKRPSVVAGSYHNQGGGYSRPRFEPSPSAAAFDARHFSLDFLPGEGTKYWGWRIKDRRESLLLIYREDWKAQHRDLVVCEPLTRRQKVIPPPNPSVNYWDDEVVLLDGGGGGGGGGIGMTSFTVFLYSYEGGRIRACMFTSGSSSWCKKNICKPPRLFVVGFAAGRRYWHDREKMVIAFDQSTLKFSSFVLPNHQFSERRKMTLKVGHDGEACIVVDGDGIIKIFARQKGDGSGEGGEEWALEKTIQLSAAMLGLPEPRFLGLTRDQPQDAGMMRIILRHDRGGVPGVPSTSMRFHLNMETMEVECLPSPDLHYGGYPYEFPWPPSLRA
ncbi:hypothetical protein HU200_005866 [Digitaria exilis]|uniref:F-box protein AT5G49610-like beta-propeller domain-containing protein n=1 Tax=Digitaria exilis TaxID=1010633 RepID=A0A835FSF7_9POAL|nr:hypothetical protein HU200_005866 [Digitaria exilis]